MADAEIGGQISRWLDISSPHDILSIGGEPVLVNWGILPRSVSSRDERIAHFESTLGRYAPWLSSAVVDQSPAKPPVEVLGEAPLAASAAPPESMAAGTETPSPHGASPPSPDVGVTTPAPRRPWLVPLAASALAALALAAISVPGVLVYPSFTTGSSAANAFELERLKTSNNSLEIAAESAGPGA